MKMDIYPHLVPMADGQCYNVKTGALALMDKRMRFTSTLGYSLKTEDDEECKEIRGWFDEVSRQRPRLSRYLKLVYALVMTQLQFGDLVFVNLGSGRNGKSLSYEVLQVHFLTFFALFFVLDDSEFQHSPEI